MQKVKCKRQKVQGKRPLARRRQGKMLNENPPRFCYNNPMKKTNPLYRINIFDVILAILVLAGSIIPVIPALAVKAGDKAVVFKDNKVLREIPLSVDARYDIGDNVELEVKGGKIRVSKTDCPRKICAHTSWLSTPAEKAICLPKRLMIEIKSVRGEGGYDAVAY